MSFPSTPIALWNTRCAKVTITISVFNGVYYRLDREMRPIMDAPFSEEQSARAKEMIERSEERRLAEMHQPDMHQVVAARFYPKDQAS